ncbi:serine hydrolase [Candidatus Palauibacter sp.]|uniref:serine hydrolase n=1 Tax=Candidatus Palauibacter sp. TaxID=3101350 RepID=UPI003D0A1501
MAVTLFAACGDSTTEPPPDPPRATTISVSPATVDLAALGATVQLSAEARDQNGQLMAGVAVTWASGTAAVATVDASGLVTAVANGSATITASAESASGSAVVRVLDFTGLLQRFIDEHGIGAAALGIMKQGAIAYDGAVGYMDAQRRVPARQDIMMRLASVTKPITAAAIHKLASDGMLALDDRVFDLGQTGGGLLKIDPFPELGDSQLADITVLHLLQHRGGWDREVAPDFAFREIEIAAALSIASPPGRENTVRFVLGQPLQFSPGARPAYSNIGYLVLGLVIEEVSGKDYMTYVLEDIFNPLGVARGDLIQGRTFPEHRSAWEPWYDSSFRCRNVFDPLGPTVWCPEGGWDHEAKIAAFGLVASTRAILAFLDAYIVFGDNIGRRRGGGEGSGWWAYHTGSLEGTNTLAFQSGNGISYVVLFNRRLPPASDYSYVELFLDVLEDQTADHMAARHTVAEAFARKADSGAGDVLISRGITIGAERRSR